MKINISEFFLGYAAGYFAGALFGYYLCKDLDRARAEEYCAADFDNPCCCD